MNGRDSPAAPRRFSEWVPLTGPEASASVPRVAGTVQVKVARGLVAYPRGRSAMVFYASAPDLRRLVADRAAALVAAADAAGLGPLRLRWREGDPSRDGAEIFALFVERFGAVPILNRRT